MARILVAEDEARIANFVVRGLKLHGYQAAIAKNGKVALEMLAAEDFDLLILDIGLPLLDGYEVLTRLRASGSQIPVIVLTARSAVTDTVASLERGADDYMPKPFRFEELLARLRLRLRSGLEARDAERGQTTQLQHGLILLDLADRTVRVKDKPVELSAREFSLLVTFMERPGEALSRQFLLEKVWGYDFDPGSNVVDVYVRYLRNKIGAHYFETVRSVGYRLTNGAE